MRQSSALAPHQAPLFSQKTQLLLRASEIAPIWRYGALAWRVAYSDALSALLLRVPRTRVTGRSTGDAYTVNVYKRKHTPFVHVKLASRTHARFACFEHTTSVSYT